MGNDLALVVVSVLEFESAMLSCFRGGATALLCCIVVEAVVTLGGNVVGVRADAIFLVIVD